MTKGLSHYELKVLTFSTADTLAPLSSSSSTISMFLIFVALISGVSPSYNNRVYNTLLLVLRIMMDKHGEEMERSCDI